MSFFKEIKEEFAVLDKKKYGHGHLYYFCAILSLSLFLVSLVEAIVLQVYSFIFESYLVFTSFLVYIIAILFFIVAIRCFVRGHGHYKYPPHKKK